MWIYFVLIFGIFKGIRDGLKKKSLEKSSVIEVLFFYTLIGFILIIPTILKNPWLSEPMLYVKVFIKSLVVFTSWILSFYALKKIPVSLYGVLDLVRMVYSTLCGVFLLNEVMKMNQIIGFILVIFGLILVNNKKGMKGEQVQGKYIALTLLSSILTATSGVMDKFLMRSMTDSQLQFWFMLFMLLMYVAYIIVTKSKIDVRCLKNNYWILILSVLFVIGDKVLFIANGDPNSKVTVMTVLKQSSAIVSIIMGRLMFKEKNILYRLLCCAIVLAGIIIAVL